MNLRLVALLALSILAARAQSAPPSPAANPPSPAAPTPLREIALPAPSMPDAERFKNYFGPLRTEQAAISHDGRYLAYSLREDDRLSVLVLDLDHPSTATAKVLVGDAETSTPILSRNQHERTPSQILWMRWLTPTRVVVQTNRVTDFSIDHSGGATPTPANSPADTWVSLVGAVLAFDFNGANAGILVTPRDLREELGGFNAATSSAPNPFSLDRRERSFENRTNSPDRPTSEPLAAVATVSEIPSSSESSGPPPRPGSLPRSMRVLRLDATHPGAFQLLATGSARAEATRSLELFTVNGTNGNMETLAGDIVRVDRDFLLDQQGRLRITIPNAIIPGFPHYYEYLGPKGHSLLKRLAASFDGGAEFVVTPGNFFGVRELPIAFDRTGDVLYYASNRGRDTFGVFSRNLATGQRGGPMFEHPIFDLIAAPMDAFPPDTLVFDPHTQELAGIRYDAAMRTATWLRPEWREVQGTLEQLLPGRAVDIVDWDQAGRRFVVATQGPADAGGFYVFDREKSRLSEFARRAPWLDAAHTFATLPFGFVRADGLRITGLVTVPAQPRIKPIPVVVVCPDSPWQRVRSDFRPEIHALTDMGFAVVQFNGRGAWGLGLKHRDALKPGYDVAQVEDILGTLDELEKRFQINRDRVALFGRGHGGFIALRALQDHPERFRCAVALDAPVNLADWLKESYWTKRAALPQLQIGAFGDAARLAAAPLEAHPEKITKPILLLSYPGPDGELRSGPYLAARAFAHATRKTAEVTFGDLSMDYARGLPQARAAVFGQVEEFLNLHIYSYKVRPSEIRSLGEAPK